MTSARTTVYHKSAEVNMGEPERITLTIREAAKAIGIHEQTLRRYVRRGIVPAVRLGSRVLIPVEALRRLIEAQAGGKEG